MSACLTDADVAALVDGELPAAAREQALAHVDGCDACRGLVAGAASRSPETADPALPLARGTEVGRHVILELLGAGAMGSVYAAWDPVLDRKVALKRLHAGGDAQRARLAREARAMAKLSHPHVVTVHDVAEHGGEIYLAMELVEGGTLARWLRAAPRRPRDVVRVFRDAGEGLAAAHAAGIVHRDFKPENVLVGDDGRVKVSDFGLARSGEGDLLGGARGGSPVLTQAGTLVGTPAYMAPEQLAGTAASAQSDQFAFAVAIHEALTGARPGADAVRDRRIPAWVWRVLRRALAKDPAARWPDLRAMLRALDRGAPSWPRRIAVGGVAAAAIAVTAWVLARPAAAAPVCRGAAAAYGDVWTEAQRDAARAALGARFDAVDRAMTDYRAAWIVEHTDACEDTRVRRELSEARLDQRMRCLDEARALAVAVAETGVGDLAQVAQTLPAPGDCARTPDLPPAPIPAPTVGAPEEGDELERAIARARTVAYTYRWAEVSPIVDPALAEAERRGDARARARLLALRGEVRFFTKDKPGGYADLAEAGAIAYRLGDDATAADAWTKLSELYGFRDGRAAEARQWLAMGRAAVERLGGDRERTARLDQSEGSILFYDEDDMAGAERAVRRARDAFVALHGEDYYLALSTEEMLGGILEEAGRFDEALATFQDVVDGRSRVLGAEHPVTYNARVNVALVLGDLKRPAQAEAILREVVAKTPDHLWAHTGLGDALYDQGRYDEALAVHQHAFEMSDGANVARIGVARDLIAVGRPGEAIALIEAHAPDVAWIETELAALLAKAELAAGHPR